MEHRIFASLDVHKTEIEYRRGEYIFKEGTNTYGVFCLLDGKVKLVKSGEDGRSHILRLYRAGDVLGYRSLFGEFGYNSSAVAIEDCKVSFIDRDVFLKNLNEDISLALEVLKIFSRELKMSDNHLANLAQKSVRKRTAEALLFIHETYGFEEDGKTLAAIFTREEIANIVGAATESMIRILSDFRTEGLVELDNKKIIIPSIDNVIKEASL